MHGYWIIPQLIGVEFVVGVVHFGGVEGKLSSTQITDVTVETVRKHFNFKKVEK